MNDGGPAFPRASDHADEAGMSLRDFFAAHCPLAMDDTRTWEEESVARYAYADAMLAARSRAGNHEA